MGILFHPRESNKGPRLCENTYLYAKGFITTCKYPCVKQRINLYKSLLRVTIMNVKVKN